MRSAEPKAFCAPPIRCSAVISDAPLGQATIQILLTRAPAI